MRQTPSSPPRPTFINEMADLCEQVGANVQDVARGMGLDNRIGAKFLHAGPVRDQQEFDFGSRVHL